MLCSSGAQRNWRCKLTAGSRRQACSAAVLLKAAAAPAMQALVKSCLPCSVAVARKAISDASKCEDRLTAFCQRSVAVCLHMSARTSLWSSVFRNLRWSVALKVTCLQMFFCGCFFPPPGVRRTSIAAALPSSFVVVVSAILFDQGLISFAN